MVCVMLTVSALSLFFCSRKKWAVHGHKNEGGDSDGSFAAPGHVIFIYFLEKTNRWKALILEAVLCFFCD